MNEKPERFIVLGAREALEREPKPGGVFIGDYFIDSWVLLDTERNEIVGHDGGEPEDQILLRDWDWVGALANKISAERDEQRERAELAKRDYASCLRAGLSTTEALHAAIKERDAAIEERDRWKRAAAVQAAAHITASNHASAAVDAVNSAATLRG